MSTSGFSKGCAKPGGSVGAGAEVVGLGRRIAHRTGRASALVRFPLAGAFAPANGARPRDAIDCRDLVVSAGLTVCPQPARESSLGSAGGGDGEHGQRDVGLARDESPAVERQEEADRQECGALVASDEGMVLRQADAVARGKISDIRRAVGYEVQGPGKRRLQQPLVLGHWHRRVQTGSGRAAVQGPDGQSSASSTWPVDGRYLDTRA